MVGVGHVAVCVGWRGFPTIMAVAVSLLLCDLSLCWRLQEVSVIIKEKNDLTA